MEYSDKGTQSDYDVEAAGNSSSETLAFDDVLRAVTDSGGSLAYATDCEGRFIFANRALQEAIGVPRDRLIGKSRDEIMDAESAAQHWRNDLEVMQSGRPLTTEETNPERDGVHTYLTVKTPLIAANGDIQGVVGISTDVTERKRAEAALRESETEFRTLAEAMPQIVWATLPDGANIYFNQRWMEYTGLSLEESYGSGWSAPFHPDDKQRSEEAWQRATSTGGIYELEVRLRRADGVYRWWLIRGVPHRDTTGEIIKWFGTCTDIDELKRAEEARQKFVMLADSSSEFIGMCDLDMQPLYVNPAGLRMVGLPDMTAGCQVQMQDYFFPEDQRFIVEEFFPRVLREGHGDVEIRLRHFQTGEPIWMFYYLYSVRDASGEIVGWATVSRDITERRRAEEQLAANAERLRARADASAAFAAAGADYQSLLDLVTRTLAERLQGSCQVRLLSDDGKTLDLVADHYPDPASREAARQLCELEPMRVDAPESLAARSLVGVPMSVHGTMIGSIAVNRSRADLPAFTEDDRSLVQDLADRAALAIANARLMKELEIANRDLELRVQERTEEFECANGELTAANEELAAVNEELVVTNESLDEATRAKSTFLSSMSHELRTPLNSILGFSDIMLKGMAGPLTGEQTRQLGMVSDSGKHLLDLVNDLLDLAKIEAGRLTVESSNVEVQPLALSAIETVRPLAAMKGLEVVCACPESIGSIATDRTRVEQILLNLLGNAVKFTNEGRVSLAVSRTGSHVVFTVEDTGRGISREEIVHIFEEFVQVGSRDTTQVAGTGLGLSVSAGLTELLGGRLTVESEIGKGSCFTLSLPA